MRTNSTLDTCVLLLSFEASRLSDDRFRQFRHIETCNIEPDMTWGSGWLDLSFEHPDNVAATAAVVGGDVRALSQLGFRFSRPAVSWSNQSDAFGTRSSNGRFWLRPFGASSSIGPTLVARL